MSQVRRVPVPREALSNPDLTRPDWTAGTLRDSRLLWLDKNENGDPEWLALVAVVVAETSPRALWTYPESAPVYHKLAAHLGVSAANLVLTAGSDGAIRSVFEAFVRPGDVVIHTRPTFAMYPVYCKMYGARVLPVEYLPAERGPRLPLETLLRAIDEGQPRLVCLPNPDSPTGTIMSPGELRAVIEAAGGVGAAILVDEAYHPFYEETALPWIDEYAHLIIARTFAKAWGLAGLRVGYAAACPEVTATLHKVRPMYEVSTFAVAVVERMLDFGEEMLASVGRLNAGKEVFLAAMRDLGFRTYSAKGNFLHASFGRRAPLVHAALENLVLYRRDFAEPCLKGFSRFSATTAERFKPVIEQIRKVVS